MFRPLLLLATAASLAAAAQSPAAPGRPAAGSPPAAAPHLRQAFESCPDDGQVLALAIGSDWNPASLRVRDGLWRSPAFAAALPKGSVLVCADYPEKRAVNAIFDKLPPPPEGIRLDTAQGSSYRRQPDGAWLIEKRDAAPEAEQLTLRFSVPAGSPAAALALDLRCHPSLVDLGPGASGNGHLGIKELRLRDAQGRGIPLVRLVANRDNHIANAVMIDAQNDDGGGQVWGSSHGPGAAIRLLLAAAAPLAPGDYSFEIDCRSGWPRHQPGHFSFALIPASLGQAALDAEELRQGNAEPGLDTVNLPAVFAFDKQRRPLGQLRPVQVGDDPAAAAADLARQIARSKAAYARLDAAAKLADPAARFAESAAAAEILDGTWRHDQRKALINELHRLPGADSDPWLWRLDFNQGAIPGEIDQAAKAGKEKGAAAALARAEEVIRSPRAARLTGEQKQQFFLAAFRSAKAVGASWPDQERILRRIIQLDPASHFGIGARGQLDIRGEGDEPSIAYGVTPRQLKPGRQKLAIRRGLSVQMPVAADYILEIHRRGGSQGRLVLHGAAFVDAKGARFPAAKLAAPADIDGPPQKLRFSLPEGTEPASLHLELDLEAEATPAAGCTFSLDPALPEEKPSASLDPNSAPRR